MNDQTMTTPDAQTTPEVPVIQLLIPEITKWHGCSSNRIAVEFDDIHAAATILAYCDAALVAAEDNQAVEGTDFCVLMAQVAHVRRLLYDITRRFYEGDVLPYEERPSPIPGAENEQNSATGGKE